MAVTQVAFGDLSERTTNAIRETLAGRRRGFRAALPLAGPAVIASVAYMDPGNFATNIQAGAGLGYQLLWVVLLANAIAMIFQALSAKLGIVTGRNLAQLCREQFPQSIVVSMWIASEVAAMATDLAEFIGGAIGLSILFHVPLVWGMVVTGIITYALLVITRNGFRSLELVIGALVGLIGLAYVAELFLVPPNWRAAGLHTIVPQLWGTGAIPLAVGIVGATVMPHAIFLHSSLTQARAPARSDDERRRLVRFSNREVVVALSIAGLVNGAMLMMASGAFHVGHSGIAQIEDAYRMLLPLFGAGAAVVFLVSLMASGIASSVVGTMAGQVIMQGFVGVCVPIWARRLITMVPSFAVVAMGIDATNALVWSQIILSVVLPLPLVALLVLSRRRSLMGPFTCGPLVTISAVTATFAIVGLNVVLVFQYLPH